MGSNCLLQLNVSVGAGFAIEFFATLQLVLCIIAVTDKRRTDVTGSAPLAIGLSVGLGHLTAVSESQSKSVWIFIWVAVSWLQSILLKSVILEGSGTCAFILYKTAQSRALKGIIYYQVEGE